MFRNTLALVTLLCFSSAPLVLAQNDGRIAYQSGRPDLQVIVMNPDGSSKTELAPTAGSPTARYDNVSWSPDGRRLATRLRDGRIWDIYLVDADGSQVVNLTNDSFVDRAPSWSPDGSRVAYVSNHDARSEIFVIDSQGGPATQLTDNTALDETPNWSPDGTQIVFASNRDGDFEIYVMNADGTDQRRLTNSPREEFYPEWSPNGEHIAFFSDNCTSCSAQQSDIMLIRPDGSGLVNLTNSPDQNVGPTWSPDGSMLAFSSDRDGRIDVFTMLADGSQVRNVTSDDPSGFCVSPAWSGAGVAATAIEAISWAQAKIDRR